MRYYLCKGIDNPGLFLPENLISQPFKVPKAVIQKLKIEDFYLYIFDKPVSKGVLIEYNIQTIMELEVDDINELRETLKEISFWNILSYFN